MNHGGWCFLRLGTWGCLALSKNNLVNHHPLLTLTTKLITGWPHLMKISSQDFPNSICFFIVSYSFISTRQTIWEWYWSSHLSYLFSPKWQIILSPFKPKKCKKGDPCFWCYVFLWDALPAGLQHSMLRIQQVPEKCFIFPKIQSEKEDMKWRRERMNKDFLEKTRKEALM